MREIPLSSVLFLDIETVPLVYDYHDLLPKQKDLFEAKTRFLPGEPVQKYDKAGIYAEFGKIICVSVGFVSTENDSRKIKLKSFYSDDEKKLLEDLCEFMKRNSNTLRRLCAHNGKEFDFPWLCRRMIINGIPVPALLNLQGKKPWESPHLDTLELWKFGDYKNYTSLELLAEILNIPSPKDDIKGSDVARIYWKENDLLRIKNYCQRDVVALILVFLRLRGEYPGENYSLPDLVADDVFLPAEGNA